MELLRDGCQAIDDQEIIERVQSPSEKTRQQGRVTVRIHSTHRIMGQLIALRSAPAPNFRESLRRSAAYTI